MYKRWSSTLEFAISWNLIRHDCSTAFLLLFSVANPPLCVCRTVRSLFNCLHIGVSSAFVFLQCHETLSGKAAPDVYFSGDAIYTQFSLEGVSFILQLAALFTICAFVIHVCACVYLAILGGALFIS